MKILVVGRGWTGKKMFGELMNRKHEVVICSHSTVFQEIASTHYDWVINCAGVTGSPNVDACELDKVGTIEANALFPIKLYHACEKQGNIKFAHFSSGCIYQGEITDVNADPNYFGSIYSLSKGISDLYLKDKALVFRIRMPFTGVDEKKNYLCKVLNYAKTTKLINSGQNSLTDLDEAIAAAACLIEEGMLGPVNLVNSGSIDMQELATLMGINNVNWFTPEEFKKATIASRSTCVIPAHPKMLSVDVALRKAITQISVKSNR
jgi:nucleoside-diphosphate-sugar epimerase